MILFDGQIGYFGPPLPAGYDNIQPGDLITVVDASRTERLYLVTEKWPEGYGAYSLKLLADPENC